MIDTLILVDAVALDAAVAVAVRTDGSHIHRKNYERSYLQKQVLNQKRYV